MQGPIMTQKTSASCSPPPTTNTLQATGNRQGRDRCLLVSCLPTHTHATCSTKTKPPGGPSGPTLNRQCMHKDMITYTHACAHIHTQAHTQHAHTQPTPPVVAPPPTHSGKSLLVLGPKPPSGPSPGWHPGLTQFLPRGSRRRKEGGCADRESSLCSAAFPRPEG